MAGSMCQRAGQAGWFRDRMVIPDGLLETAGGATWTGSSDTGPKNPPGPVS